MKKRLLILIGLLAFLGTLPLHAQDYFGDDYAFFLKKSELYQRWLDAQGLGAALRVDTIALKKNGMELELFLCLRTSDPDTAAALWTALESTYGSREHSLGALLFNTFVRMMEIPPAQGNVQVYFPLPRRAGPGYDPCFYVWVWEQDGKVQQESRINNCKAQPLAVEVRAPKVKKPAAAARAAVGKREQAQEVFGKILQYARARYERVVCEDRYPRVEEEERGDYVLKFSVGDLCREVLTEERKSAWCTFVQTWWGPCNDMRRERLEFTFVYSATDEGYLLTGTLTGKFGSGVYRPRKSGYMDMEPDFEEDFLKPYVQRFQQDLKAYLER